MVGVEWNILAGIITAAFGSGIAWATIKVGYGTRISHIEKFVDRHPGTDETYRTRCHSELLQEIKDVRRSQEDGFAQVNERLDKVITFRRRNGDKESD